jgi:hypothetical protein
VRLVATIEAILDGLKTTLEAAIGGLTVYDTIPSVANLPAVVPVPRSGSYEAGMGAGVDDTYLIDLDTLCAATVSQLGQQSLNAHLSGAGPRSIRQAIYQSRDIRRDVFGLVNTKAWVRGWSGYGRGFPGASIDHVGAVIRLEVITSAMQ